jgi:hypothetical protein
MTQQPSERDPKNIWQSQETERTNMSVEEIRQKARKFLSKNRRDSAAGFAFTLVMIVFCAIVLLTARMTLPRIVAGLVMTMTLVQFTKALRFSYKKYGRIWPAPTLGGDAALTTCLEFYRNELERQREMRKVPTWQLAVTFLIIGWLTRDALLRTSPDLLRVALPFVLISAAGLILLLAVRKFEARRVQAELDALDRFEEETH